MTRSSPASIFAAMLPRHAAALVLPALLACASGAARRGGSDVNSCIHSTALLVPEADILGVLTRGTGNLVLTGSETDSLNVDFLLTTGSREGCISRPPGETIDKGDSVFVTVTPRAGSTLDLQIRIPERLTVDLRDEARDIIVTNVENRIDVLEHARGFLRFDDIEGPLTIEDGSGQIRIHDVRGPIVIRDQGGGIAIDDVKNTVIIEAGAGDVVITNTGANVQLVMGAGRLLVRNVTGSLTYRKTGSGEVTIEGVTGGVERL